MKNSRGFLIIPLLLFSILFLPTSVQASVITQANINYTLTDTFQTTLDVILKNDGRNTAVVNYYTIVLPYQNISNIKLTMAGRKISHTVFKQKNGTEVIINLQNLVIQGRSSDTFKVSFQSTNTIDNNWGYAKLRSKIEGLKINKVTFMYDKSKPEISYINGANLTKIDTGNYEFNNINASTITLNFGSPVTFKYSFNKTYLNNDVSEVVQEVVLPTTDNTQTLILTNISPQPVSKRIDSENNVILGFKIDPGKQTVVDISGYLVRNKNEGKKETYNEEDLNTTGFWSLSNQFERIRLENFLKENQYDKTPINISKFVASRFNLEIDKNEGQSSFENALRMGPDTAIGRKDSAIAEDYVDLLITLLRENSIPARMIVGYLPKSHQFISDGAFHSWVQYYDLKQEIWFNLDPSTADLFKSPDYDANNYNSLKLLVRSKHYNLPKLPFITNKDLKIDPTSENVTELFNVDINGNEVTNIGNTIVVIDLKGKSEVLLPKDTVKINQVGDIVAQTLYGSNKSFNIKASEVASPDSKINILSEIILATLFLTVSSFVIAIYAKIKHVR